MNDPHIYSNAALMEVDSLRFTIPASNTSNYTEETAMLEVADAIANLLGENSSVEVAKCGSSHVINITQPNYRLSEILSKEISRWISSCNEPQSSSGEHTFEIILPHSISVNASSTN